MLVATFLACAAAAACAASSSPASSAAPAAAPPLAYFKQDRFAISMWVDPQVVPAEYDERYLEIAQANFTVLLGNFGATKISSVTAQLAACEKHGLKAVVSACEGGKTLPPTPRKPGGTCVGIEHPALWGFQLRDEPSAKDFVDVRGGFPILSESFLIYIGLSAHATAARPSNILTAEPGLDYYGCIYLSLVLVFLQLGAWSADVARRRPGNVLRFINLLPNYAPPAALSGNATAPMNYGEHSRRQGCHSAPPAGLCLERG